MWWCCWWCRHPSGVGHSAIAMNTERRGIGFAQDQTKHIDATGLELTPQRFRKNHVEGLGPAMGDHVGASNEAGPGADQHDAAAPARHHTTSSCPIPAPGGCSSRSKRRAPTRSTTQPRHRAHRPTSPQSDRNPWLGGSRPTMASNACLSRESDQISDVALPVRLKGLQCWLCVLDRVQLMDQGLLGSAVTPASRTRQQRRQIKSPRRLVGPRRSEVAARAKAHSSAGRPDRPPRRIRPAAAVGLPDEAPRAPTDCGQFSIAVGLHQHGQR
jgi:hypothetical protein